MPDIEVNIGTPGPAVRALHGLSNGPVTYGSLVDVTHLYRALRIPWIRLHDSNWPHPREVDIPQIFRDFGADPDDPASYDFRRTDDYLASVLATGARIVYRLGVSIEHTRRKYHIDPPADPAKWARICVNVIRHYDQGWAEGFRHGITHWEIWNEPDQFGPSSPMWTGDWESYLELYRHAAVAIKKLDPALKVGGYAAAHPSGPLVDAFLTFCRDQRLPLDFLSWHRYTSDPMVLAERARLIRAAMDGHGFGDAESVLDEWNIMPDWKVFAPGRERDRRLGFERQKNEEGASYVAAVLCLMQDEPVDVMTYYDGQPMALFCGLFDCYGVPQKTWYAIRMFRFLLDLGRRAEVKHVQGQDGLYALASSCRERGETAVLISHNREGAASVELSVRGIAGRAGAWEAWRIDREASPFRLETGTFAGDELRTTCHFPGFSVVLIRLGARLEPLEWGDRLDQPGTA